MLRIDFGRLRIAMLIGLLGVLVINADTAPMTFAQSDAPKVPETTSEPELIEDEEDESFSEDLPDKTEKSITSPPNIH